MSDNANVGRVFNLTGGGGGNGLLKLVSISVKTPPKKTTYKSGDIFDPDGMIVEAEYGYGITAEVTGYSINPTVLTDGVNEVTVMYTEGRVTKTATTPVTVKKVLTDLKISNNPNKMTYNYLEKFDPDGMILTAIFSDGSSSAVTDYTYSTTQFTELGQKTVEIKYSYENVEKTISLEINVVAIQLQIPAQKSTIIYDGQMKTPSWDSNYDAFKMSFSGNTTGTNADTYTVTFETNYGYIFTNGTRKAVVNWVIDRARIPSLPVQSNVLVADGTQKTPKWSGYTPSQLTQSGDLFGVEVGEYHTIFTPTSNYQWWDNTITGKEATWSINSILVTIPTQKGSLTYTGTPQTPEWDNFDQENSSVKVTASTDAGEYNATFTLKVGKWTDGTSDVKTIKWKINRATITAVPEQSGTLTYDGNPKTPLWDSSYDDNKMSVRVDPATNAGTDYIAYFTPTSNYQWWDESIDEKSATWSINKAENKISVSPESLTLNMNAKTGKIIVTRNGDGVITATSDNTNVVTVGTINSASGEIEIKSVDDTSGTAKITIKVAEGINHLASDDVEVEVKATFREYLYGYDLNLTDSNPATRVTYPRDVDNAGFSAAKMQYPDYNVPLHYVATIVSDSNSTTDPSRVEDNALCGSATFSINHRGEVDIQIYAESRLEIIINGNVNVVEYHDTFTYQGAIGSMTVIVSAGRAIFEKFISKSIFDYGGWPQTPGEKFMPRPCMLTFAGVVDYYLNPNDYTQKDVGGLSDVSNLDYGGNAMMEWPKIWTKRWEDADGYHFRCSDIQVDSDYECWSNYDRQNNQIPHFYTPIYFGSMDSSNRLRSLSDQPHTKNTTAQTEVDYAKANGDDWYTEVVADRFLIQDLLVMMFKSTNLQATLGYGVCRGSMIAPGTMNYNGLFWGSANAKNVGVKVFGMENWWGNAYRRTAGWMLVNRIHKVKLTRGTKDGTTASDYNVDGTGYLDTGARLDGEGYINGMKTEKYGRLPIATTGSSTTYEADEVLYGGGTRYASCGGNQNYDTGCGPFFVNLYNLATDTGSSGGIGAALSCKPLAAT